jgi:hypothetical protein
MDFDPTIEGGAGCLLLILACRRRQNSQIQARLAGDFQRRYRDVDVSM